MPVRKYGPLYQWPVQYLIGDELILHPNRLSRLTTNRLWPYAMTMAFAGFILLLASWFRPYPFSTTDDNWMYFLPLIKAHTDATLHGTPLRILWSLGAGWNPWENAQVGILYIPYHIANLLARLLGHPLALLEISAWLHLGAAGLIAYHYAPAIHSKTTRIGWGMLAILAPGPFLIGLNWHNYLTCYPWFLALAFQLQTLVKGPPDCVGRRHRLWIALSVLGFLLSAHAQMFVIGLGMLALWLLADNPYRRAIRALLQCSLSLLPTLVPLLFLKVLSLEGTQDWMGERSDPFYLLRHAQSLSGVIHGLVFGNLLFTRDFQLWANISWTGVGIFFSPALVLLISPALRSRRWKLLAFFAACLVFMGAASFPALRHLAVGPLAGFRWTWKIAIFVGPLAMVSLLPHWAQTFRSRGKQRILQCVMGLCSLIVCLRGLSFEIWPSLSRAHWLGATGIVEETQKMANNTGLMPGTRIALLGPYNMVQNLPVPLMGLIGNAPILSGLETAHIYEPMEPEWASRAHFGLSLPWRRIIPEQTYLEQPERVEQALLSIGVQALVGLSPELAKRPNARSFQDRNGQITWVIPLPNACRAIYPFCEPGGTRLLDGRLKWPANTPIPKLLSPRPIVWRQVGDFQIGQPESLPWGWILGTVLASLAAFVGLLYPPAILAFGPAVLRHQDDPSAAPPRPKSPVESPDHEP
ncbi:MAG: hypothetical protein H6Q00_2165 [Holophagaceae bacterium]|nr:hypothetical protein [Holophagaceae bacterium]